MRVVKRLLIFAMLGPLLALCIAFAAVPYLAHSFRGNITVPVAIQLAMIFIPYAYLLGIVPALITGAVDHFVGRRLATIAVGAACAIPVLYSTTWMKVPYMVMGAILLGGIPAAVCSWIAGRLVSITNEASVNDIS